jgi:hypothetical protein
MSTGGSMSSHIQETSRPEASSDYEEWQHERGSGWMAFAATLLLILGVLTIIQGIAPIPNAQFYVADARYVFGDLNTWGWVVLILGVAQLLAGLGVLVANQVARWAGVLILGLNAIAQLLMMPAYAFWSPSLFALTSSRCMR